MSKPSLLTLSFSLEFVGHLYAFTFYILPLLNYFLVIFKKKCKSGYASPLLQVFPGLPFVGAKFKLLNTVYKWVCRLCPPASSASFTALQLHWSEDWNFLSSCPVNVMESSWVTCLCGVWIPDSLLLGWDSPYLPVPPRPDTSSTARGGHGQKLSNFILRSITKV